MQPLISMLFHNLLLWRPWLLHSPSLSLSLYITYFFIFLCTWIKSRTFPILGLAPCCNDSHPTEPKGALTTLKNIYKVKRNSYIYSSSNFLLYPMWHISNILPCRHNIVVVSHGMVGLNRQTTHNVPDKPLYWGQGLVLMSFVMTRS